MRAPTKLKQIAKRRAEGFTIVEVMIVLAVAALIMLVVFLAVPALQRNSHNSQRKSDVAHMAGLITEFESNNAGTPPTTINLGVGASTSTTLFANTDKFALIKSISALGTTTAAVGAYAAAPVMVPNVFYIYNTAVCSGNAASTTNATSGNLVILYQAESSGGNQAQCTQV